MAQSNQTFEITAVLRGSQYVYRLEIEPGDGVPIRAQVANESLTIDGSQVFAFSKGVVILTANDSGAESSYTFDNHRSALTTIASTPENERIYRFVIWMGQLLCFRLNPYAMQTVAESETTAPAVDLSNFPAWYRHLVQSYPQETQEFLQDLRRTITGFRNLILENYSEVSRALVAAFDPPEGSLGPLKFGLGQLSDGQRCLIALYAVAHFVVARGGTVILDEPDNFSDKADSAGGQVILISHHPEFMNQWAPDCGYQSFREGAGPVQVKRFLIEEETGLTPAELIARGWDDV